MTKAVLLLNLGTPAAPTTKGLRDFYKYFFADPYVFDMNPLGRWMLRNLIIQPFRAPKTAKAYASIWMEGGSPLKVYADRLQQSVQAAFAAAGDDVVVLNGMAYSAPFIGESMQALEAQGVNDILVLPLFPQYSTATTASVFHGVKQAAARCLSGRLPRLIQRVCVSLVTVVSVSRTRIGSVIERSVWQPQTASSMHWAGTVIFIRWHFSRALGARSGFNLTWSNTYSTKCNSVEKESP